MSVNKVVEKYIHTELTPIIKQVIFNMSNVNINDSDMNEEFLINFFNQMKMTNFDQWKEVVKCGLDKFLHDNSIPIDNFKESFKENLKENDILNNLVYDCL